MKKLTGISILLILGLACKKPYNPPVITAAGSYLVVEGVINPGTDSTFIKLSRTVNLSGKTAINPVPGAVLTIESNQNTSYPLTQSTKGNYVSPGLNLDQTRQYRLRIKTPDGKEYLSDFEQAKITPPIDSIGFNLLSGNSPGIQIYANTHDPNNNTRYYRWDYQETWQFHAKYQSQLISNGSAIIPRTFAQDVFTCFAGDTSTSIILGSSAKLQQDVIYQSPITQIPSTSEKIETKYSILLKQYALTNDAYAFWTNLKKNTEQLGSIFDAQPSQINGNIHCISNPLEPVIGYVSISTVQQKRVFITANGQLPQTWFPSYPYSCQVDTDLFCQDLNCQNFVALFLIPAGSTEIPLIQIPPAPAPPAGYLASTLECIDCTLRGTKKQPSFWK
jgi:hypothetical protein